MKDLKPSLLDPDKLTLILDSLRIGIIIHTPERIILAFNKEAERIAARIVGTTSCIHVNGFLLVTTL